MRTLCWAAFVINNKIHNEKDIAPLRCDFGTRKLQ